MRKVPRLFFRAALCGLLATASAHYGQETRNARYPSVPQALIMCLTGNHYPGIARALSTVGFQVR